jgi:predicted anti-sigma-YlaC factor YlaD
MSLQLDGVSKPEEMERLSGHLTVCPRCQERWTALQDVHSLLAGAASVEPPPGLTAKVLERLPGDRRAVVVPSPVWVRAGLLASAAVVVLLIGVGAIVLMTVAFGQNDWSGILEGGRAAVASAWKNASRLFAAAKDVARAVWLGFGRPWLPIVVPAVAAAAFLWGWLLYQGRRELPRD